MTVKYVPINCHEDEQLHNCIAKLDDMAHMLFSRCARFLTGPEQVEFQEVVQSLGLSYQWMRHYVRIAGIMAFPVTPKVHQIQHLPAQAYLINPARVTNYSEEGCVGSVCRIFKSSKFGRYLGRVQEVVLRKRLFGLFLRLEGYDG